MVVLKTRPRVCSPIAIAALASFCSADAGPNLERAVQVLRGPESPMTALQLWQSLEFGLNPANARFIYEGGSASRVVSLRGPGAHVFPARSLVRIVEGGSATEVLTGKRAVPDPEAYLKDFLNGADIVQGLGSASLVENFLWDTSDPINLPMVVAAMRFYGDTGRNLVAGIVFTGPGGSRKGTGKPWGVIIQPEAPFAMPGGKVAPVGVWASRPDPFLILRSGYKDLSVAAAAHGLVVTDKNVGLRALFDGETRGLRLYNYTGLALLPEELRKLGGRTKEAYESALKWWPIAMPGHPSPFEGDSAYDYWVRHQVGHLRRRVDSRRTEPGFWQQ